MKQTISLLSILGWLDFLVEPLLKYFLPILPLMIASIVQGADVIGEVVVS
jgi:hypothetical protein